MGSLVLYGALLVCSWKAETDSKEAAKHFWIGVFFGSPEEGHIHDHSIPRACERAYYVEWLRCSRGATEWVSEGAVERALTSFVADFAERGGWRAELALESRGLTAPEVIALRDRLVEEHWARVPLDAKVRTLDPMRPTREVWYEQYHQKVELNREHWDLREMRELIKSQRLASRRLDPGPRVLRFLLETVAFVGLGFLLVGVEPPCSGKVRRAAGRALLLGAGLVVLGSLLEGSASPGPPGLASCALPLQPLLRRSMLPLSGILLVPLLLVALPCLTLFWGATKGSAKGELLRAALLGLPLAALGGWFAYAAGVPLPEGCASYGLGELSLTSGPVQVGGSLVVLSFLGTWVLRQHCARQVLDSSEPEPQAAS